MPIAGVTTCRTTPATWTDYVTSENNIMFRHVMGNDPRPHFMHQSNLADYNPALPETDPNQGGILYPVIDGLLGRYDAAIDRASAPLVQLTSTQIAATLAQQSAWAANLAAGKVVGVAAGRRAARQEPRAARAIDVPADGDDGRRPLRRAEVGLDEHPGRRRAGLLAQRPGQRRGPDRVGHREGGLHAHGEQRRMDRHGADRLRLPVAALRRPGCVNIPGATDATYRVTAADGNAKLRVVVSAGNWVSSVSQAAVGATDRRPGAEGRGRLASRRRRSPRAWP